MNSLEIVFCSQLCGGGGVPLASFGHFDVISMVDKSAVHVKLLLSICFLQ